MKRAVTIFGLATLLTACADDAMLEFADMDGGVDSWSALDEIEIHEDLLRCPDEVASPADVAQYADAIDEDRLGSLYEALRDLALGRLDASCLEDCSVPPARECVRASCETAAGDAVEYSRIEETRPAETGTDGRGEIVEVAESIEVEPASDSVGWSHLWLTRRGLLDEGPDGDRELWEIEARWQGSLLPGWPADGRLSGELREWSEGEDWGAVAEWTTGDCRVVVGAGDVLMNRSGAQIRVAARGRRVEARPFEGDTDRLDGWVDGRCAGEIDPSSWEIIGPCLDDRSPTDTPRAATGRTSWDDGSYPIRRCGERYCVALKTISCLRGD